MTQHPSSAHAPTARSHFRRDPKRFRRKILAELKRRTMTSPGAIERLLYLALLARASRMPAPTGESDSDQNAKLQARTHLRNTLRRLTSAHSALSRAERLGWETHMVGVQRLLYNAEFKPHELVEIVNLMRAENVSLPDAVFAGLLGDCSKLAARRSGKQRRSSSSRFGRRLRHVARELESAA